MVGIAAGNLHTLDIDVADVRQRNAKLLQPIMDKMNAWMQTGSAYAGQYIYCDVPDVECGELAFTQDDFWTAYLPAVHPTAAGHRYIADRILSVLPDTVLLFEDVPEGAWYYMDVAACYYRSLMVGVADTRFAPDLPLDRAMVATIVHRIAGAPDATGTNMPFRDVPAGAYYAQPVLWAYHAGVVNGCGADTFCPTQAISRQDLTVILYRYACLAGIADAAQSENVLSGFADADAVSDYARAALSCACCIPHSRNCGAAPERSLRGGFSAAKQLKTARSDSRRALLPRAPPLLCGRSLARNTKHGKRNARPGVNGSGAGAACFIRHGTAAGTRAGCSSPPRTAKRRRRERACPCRSR